MKKLSDEQLLSSLSRLEVRLITDGELTSERRIQAGELLHLTCKRIEELLGPDEKKPQEKMYAVMAYKNSECLGGFDGPTPDINDLWPRTPNIPNNLPAYSSIYIAELNPFGENKKIYKWDDENVKWIKCS